MFFRRQTSVGRLGPSPVKLPTFLTKRPRLNVLEKIEAVFEGIADALINETEGVAIELKVRATQPVKTRSFEDEDKNRRIRFPGKTAEEAWRFSEVIEARPLCFATDTKPAVVTRILELIHEALRNGTVLSKRYATA